MSSVALSSRSSPRIEAKVRKAMLGMKTWAKKDGTLTRRARLLRPVSHRFLLSFTHDAEPSKGRVRAV